VLDEQSVLTVACGSYIIEMWQLDKLTKDGGGVSKTTLKKIVLSLNGDTLFVLTKTGVHSATLTAWDILSGMSKPGKRVFEKFESTSLFPISNIVAVRDGVLLQTSPGTLELWNFELSECIRSWRTDLSCIMEVIAISEERVACYGGGKVIIVDTTKEGILSTITIYGRFVACNSECHVITMDREVIQMRFNDVVLWKISLKPFRDYFSGRMTFSPTEQYCVLAGCTVSHRVLCVLDVVLGKRLHILPAVDIYGLNPSYLDCKFVSEEHLVVCSSDQLGSHFLQLYDVKSGDLLNEIALESPVYSLAACPRERLIAIGFEDSKVNFRSVR